MFTEVIPADDAKHIDVSKIQTLKREKYEIRLIIWETKEVPLTNGDSVDIYVRVTFDPTGWAEDEVVKCTDTHLHSTDGRG